MVVAEADHRGHGELQHLVGRAAPDAAEHGQEIPVPELGTEAVQFQEAGQGLHQFGVLIGNGNPGAQGIEAQQVAQHPDEARVQQVAALGEDRVETGAAPFERAAAQRARRLDRERHVGLDCLDAQFFKQLDQGRIGAFVEDQEARVHAVGDRTARRGQGDVHGVGVAAKVVCGLKQGQIGVPMQCVGCSEAGDTGADDGDFHGTSWFRVLNRAVFNSVQDVLAYKPAEKLSGVLL